MNKSTLPISMKKVDMIEEYEILYHNYNRLKQTIDIQAMYIEVLMGMLSNHGITQKEINNALDSIEVFYKVEKIRKAIEKEDKNNGN